jgi:formate hydrogenlyase subunit 3/multisubunit Na+/H+ antiporter MnhD subunit
MSIIENIRSKPHSYKIRLMWVIIISVVLVLVAVWVLVNRIGNNFNMASIFFKQQAQEIEKNGKEMYEKNK